MEWKLEKQPAVARLALCVILAVAIYAAVDRAGERIPAVAPYLPWLGKNKIAAIAVAAAVLFGASLLIFPLEGSGPDLPPPDPEGDPCAGYERAGDLP